MFDASVPPPISPAGCQAVLGYVGREGFTPHVWTATEWDRFRHLRQVPAWLPDFSVGPVNEAHAAIKAVQDLGWAADETDERAIVFDFETAEGASTRAWWEDTSAELAVQGFTGVVYGSLSTILENAAADVIVADWNNTAQLLPGQTIHGHQYQAGVPFLGTQVDFSVIDEWLFERAGRGARHQ